MDARVRYTNMVIKNSFIQLLQDKPLNKITVTSICEMSSINRATFYKYYADPYDLLQQIEAELILDLQKIIEKTSSDNVEEILVTVLNKVKENGDVYAILFSNHGDNTFTSRVFSLCYQTTRLRLHELVPGISPAQQEWLYYFMAQGCVSIINSWAQNGMREEPLEVAQFMTRLTLALIKDLNQ